MTDRTENHRVFNDKKILTIVILSLTINYAFVIGTNILAVFMEENWDWEHPTKCVEVINNVFTWTMILNHIHYSVMTVSGICADIALHRYVVLINIHTLKLPAGTCLG